MPGQRKRLEVIPPALYAVSQAQFLHPAIECIGFQIEPSHSFYGGLLTVPPFPALPSECFFVNRHLRLALVLVGNHVMRIIVAEMSVFCP